MLFLIAAAAAAQLTDDQFIDFLSTYPKLTPDQVIADLGRMHPDQQTLLYDWESLGASVYTRACHSAHATDLVFRPAQGPMRCADLLALEEENIQWGMTVGAVRYAETQRIQLIQMLSCRQGWLTVTECATSTR